MKKLLQWWPLVLLAIILLMSLGGNDTSDSPQSYEDWKYESQQDEQQAIEESYRGY